MFLVISFGLVTITSSYAMEEEKSEQEIVTEIMSEFDSETEFVSILYKNIGIDGAKKLAEGLSALHNLKSLEIVKCKIENEGALAILKALPKSCSHLRFSANNLGGNNFEEEFMGILRSRLRSSCMIYSLDLSCNNICDEGALIIANNLNSLFSLRQLNLFGNNGISEKVFNILISNRCNDSMIFKFQNPRMWSRYVEHHLDSSKFWKIDMIDGIGIVKKTLLQVLSGEIRVLREIEV